MIGYDVLGSGPPKRRSMRTLSVELSLDPGRATAAGCAHQRNFLVVGSESGGGGVVTPQSLVDCYYGVRNVQED